MQSNVATTPVRRLEWTSARTAILMDMAATDLPRDIIARKLGTTVAAVTCKLHRMKSDDQPEFMHKHNVLRIRRARSSKPARSPAARPDCSTAQAVRSLTRTQCRWIEPDADPKSATFAFGCSHDKLDGHSYCETHLRRIFVPAEVTLTFHRKMSGVAINAARR